MSLDSVVNDILRSELNKTCENQSDKMICEVDEDINFKYNLFVVC